MINFSTFTKPEENHNGNNHSFVILVDERKSMEASQMLRQTKNRNENENLKML